MATQCLFELCIPRMNSAPASEREKKYKHHVFAPTAVARCMIFAKFYMVIEVIEAIKKMAFIFRSNA